MQALGAKSDLKIEGAVMGLVFFSVQKPHIGTGATQTLKESLGPVQCVELNRTSNGKGADYRKNWECRGQLVIFYQVPL